MSDPATTAIDLDRIRTEATAAVVERLVRAGAVEGVTEDCIDRLVQLEVMAILARREP